MLPNTAQSSGLDAEMPRVVPGKELRGATLAAGVPLSRLATAELALILPSSRNTKKLPLSREQGCHGVEGVLRSRVEASGDPLFNFSLLAPMGMPWAPSLLSRLHSRDLGNSGWRDMGLGLPRVTPWVTSESRLQISLPLLRFAGLSSHFSRLMSLDALGPKTENLPRCPRPGVLWSAQGPRASSGGVARRAGSDRGFY